MTGETDDCKGEGALSRVLLYVVEDVVVVVVVVVVLLAGGGGGLEGKGEVCSEREKFYGV